MELAFAIPILALVIALTFFCGYAMTNKQRVTAASRYVVWSSAYGQTAPSGDQLNAMFLRGKGEQIGISSPEGPTETLDDLVGWAGGDSPGAGMLIDQCIGDRSGHSRSAKVSAEFPSSIGAWQRFIGPRSSLHYRDGGQWIRDELSYLQPVREQYLADLDRAVLEIKGDQDRDAQMPRLADALRSLYSQRW